MCPECGGELKCGAVDYPIRYVYACQSCDYEEERDGTEDLMCKVDEADFALDIEDAPPMPQRISLPPVDLDNGAWDDEDDWDADPDPDEEP